MIPLRLAGRIARPRAISAAVGRFQSTISNADRSRPTNEFPDSSKVSVADSAVEVNTGDKNPKKPDSTGPRSRLQPKLREIRNQIEKTIRTSDDLKECVEIFDEGISYLREIQAAEKIDDFSIYTSFQKLGTSLLQRYVSSPAAVQESLDYSLNDIMETLIKNSVVHNYHFFMAMKNELRQKHYEQVLTYWVKYLECKGTVGVSDKIDIQFGFLKELDSKYSRYHVRDFTFFAYIMGAINENYEFSMDHLVSLLQVKDVPYVRRVISNFNGLGLSKDLGPDLRAFEKYTLRVARENLDVNGVQFLKKIDDAVVRKDLRMLNSLYTEIDTKEINIQTLYSIMNGFYELEEFNAIFRMFEDLISKGDAIDKSIWALMIRSMGHSSLVVPMSDKSKSDLAVNIEKMINTMVESGVQIDARILSSIVASFANLNQFDKAEKYMAKNSKIPSTHALKNNYLVGMILNKKVTEAEQQLQQFMKEDPSFTPSTTTINTLLNHYSKADNLSAVSGLVEFMNSKQIPEDIVTLTIVIDLYFKVNLKNHVTPNVKEILSLFKNSAVKLNYHTYSVIIDGLVKAQNIQAARSIYQHVKGTDKKMTLSPQILTSIIKGELDSGSINEAEALFETYITNHRNETRMWNMMISTLLNKGQENLALYYYDKLKQQPAVSPNFFTYYFLLNYFSRRDRKQIIELLLKDLSESNLTSMGSQLPKILNTLSKSYSLPANLKRFAT